MTLSGRILIIDDRADFIETYRDILTKEGYSVDTAADRSKALEKLDSAEWDVILLDIRLSGDSGPDEGVELVSEVANRAPGAKTIMVTGFATPESIKRSFAAGAYDYLEKTGQFSTLLRVKVANAIESVRERRMANLTDSDVERAIAELWRFVRAETDPHRKGKALEDLLLMVFRSIPGFTHVSSRVTNAIEEIDILLRTNRPTRSGRKRAPISCSSARTGRSRSGAARSTCSYASSNGVISAASWGSSRLSVGSPIPR